MLECANIIDNRIAECYHTSMKPEPEPFRANLETGLAICSLLHLLQQTDSLEEKKFRTNKHVKEGFTCSKE